MKKVCVWFVGSVLLGNIISSSCFAVTGEQKIGTEDPAGLIDQAEDKQVQPPASFASVKPSIAVAPTQTTIFIHNPNEQAVHEPSSSEDIYYSKETVPFDVEKAVETLKQLDFGIDEISQRILALDEQYTSTDTQYKQTRKEVMDVVNDIIATKKQLEINIDKIRMYQRIMLQSAQKIEEIRQDLTTMKDYIVRFTTFLYKVHNELYTEEGEIDDIKLFVKSEESIADTLSNTYLIESLVGKIDELISKLQQEEKQQIKRIKASNTYKVSIREEILSYQQKIDNLDQKRKYLVDYLDLYKNNKTKIEGTMEALFNTRKDTYNDIVQTIEQVKHKKYITSFSMEEKIAELKKTEPYAIYERAADISWPILPVTKVSTYFKDKKYKEDYGVEHYGIEIPAPQLTPVYAATEGIVYKINEDRGLGVSWLLLVHADGMLTIYQYLTNFFVAEGTIVRRGQLLGYSGGEPGTRGAGFISKQPNLTFMIFKGDAFIDPLSMLDLSVLSNKSLVDQKYHIKYMKDLYRRPREMYKVAFMEGDTITQRRVSFLEMYGVGLYRELAFWQDAAINSEVDLDLGICIGFAESTLGHYLSTPNNIGNVGNNDRGDRISFASALQGARLIYSTLNNQYLGKYNTILELNGYGNTNGAIYASSPYNWQNNVVKCLSMIKGYYVPDDYSFRTGILSKKEPESKEKNK